MSDAPEGVPVITPTKKQPYCKNCIHATSKANKGWCKMYSTLQENAVGICHVRSTRGLKNR